uniref:Vitrin n=1 Tax=Electrophorus electricus TaxID=8005 RepID=A0A4W4ES50_ELEEL
MFIRYLWVSFSLMTYVVSCSSVVPDIECDVRAGKVSYPEQDEILVFPVYEVKLILWLLLSSGVITNEGGKVIVKKMAGQAEYKGSLANGIRSLSLPNWRESFTVSVNSDIQCREVSTAHFRCSGVTKRTGKQTNCKVDIAFLMDGSWSIGKRRFKIQKDFLMEVSQVLSVGMAGPMMGIIQYGDDPVTEFSLRQFSSSKDLKLAIDKIVQKGGLSNVDGMSASLLNIFRLLRLPFDGKALSYINKHYFSDSNGNRGGAPNVAVILVDGWPTDKVEEASRLARESGINIFFVTIEGPDDNEKQNVVEPNFVDKAVCRTSGFFSLPVASWFALRKAVQPLVKRVCDTDRLVCSKTCLNANDIAFVIDGSSSVGTGNFRTVLQFVANVTREFEISDTDTRVGAVQYTYEQRLEFAFGQHNTKADVLNAVKRISYWSGGTSTGAAITYAAAQLFSKSKPNKRKIMIVITDGRSYDDVRAPALAVHRQGKSESEERSA